MKKFETHVRNIEEKEKNLLEILLLAQGKFGSLSIEVIEYLSRLTQINVQEINDTIEFFDFLDKGERIKNIKVCSGLSCSIKGGKNIYQTLRSTTDETKVKISLVKCMGKCAYSPNLTVDEDSYTEIKLEDLKDLY
ncbi:NAD(P)H-dependent oxidoreductase subunit E [Psychrilyobacter atlanticus]|uniref:NADH-quinone oxidoreductase subunit NuoE family protein n=1 Tax=Psychrilyobacter atlanticus TaxID=271091 RepID=UPI00040A8E17|nr:NAD(P)H-dependent oxidoreductase subunit E [Psychrilyobacter atlanticus]